MIDKLGYIFPYEKIKIPFRERREKVKWPNGNILAVHIYVAAEIWGKSFLRPDSKSVDMGGLSEKNGYNFDVGVWRALELLDKHKMKSTFFLNGASAEFHPEVMREIRLAGHEIAGHAYYQNRDAAGMNLEDEKEDIARTTAILESAFGERPRGWINPAAACSENTINLLAEQGYLWHADMRDDDLPYGIKANNKVLVEIPHRTQTTNDFAFFSGMGGITSIVKAQRSSREAASFFQDTFDDYYETARIEGPQSMVFGIHPFVGCLPDRIRALDRMIAYMKGQPGVWITTCGELAQWWREHYLK